eukprot:2397414-Rhodomonas_salina.1
MGVSTGVSDKSPACGLTTERTGDFRRADVPTGREAGRQSLVLHWLTATVPNRAQMVGDADPHNMQTDLGDNGQQDLFAVQTRMISTELLHGTSSRCRVLGWLG